ncbi:MAG: AbrB/MazE/SpoVT family DNA-binding domain-containing protein [Candidatus Omnitrophica bacterium]|nr:AbrB/MazE/SpoVT family DNA-binding domain-containing protein [Candidatus Omnitrophota bacterium]MDD5592746.1 AbrB/MazE/SpoVT family DNA-binding domain-containing protein [Candidatus Omnitrophota bacterium]
MAKFDGPKVYGAVTVGEKGQVVIPAKLRGVFGIKAGDKLFVFAKPGGFIGLMPAGQFNEFLSHMTEMLAKFKKRKNGY